MTNLRIIGLTLVWFAFCSPRPLAEHFEQPHISVFGAATTEVEPDVINWRISVTTKAPSTEKVGALHEQNVAAALQQLLEQNVEKKYLQTSQMTLNVNWERQPVRHRAGFIATTSISFKSSIAPEVHRNLWNTLSSLKAVSINGVHFDISDREKVEQNTQVKALKNARAKADLLAITLGNHIGKVLLIQEEGFPQPAPRAYARTMAMDTESATSISPGTITVTKRIKVVFTLLFFRNR